MEEAFTKIVSQVFNNWTALRLAVEHSMGGPNSQQTALEFMDYMIKYCLNENGVQVESIQDAIEDIMDEEFETICEDESPKQIAQVLYGFLSLLKQGKLEECEHEYKKLPAIHQQWLSSSQNTVPNQVEATSSSSSESDDENSPAQTDSMEHDGWTQVKSRRKR